VEHHIHSSIEQSPSGSVKLFMHVIWKSDVEQLGNMKAQALRLDTITNKDLIWINIGKPTREILEKELTKRGYPFHELDIEECLSKSHIPKITKYADYIFILFRFPSLSTLANDSNSGTNLMRRKKAGKGFSSTLHFSQLSIFAGHNFLVSIHQGDLQPLDDLFQQCKMSNSQRDELMGKSSGYLLHTIIDTLVNHIFHILMKILGNLDDIEDAVFDDRVGIVQEISNLRREITLLRQTIFPIKRIVSEITNVIQKFSEEDLTKYFNDVEDHINKVLEVLESSKETIEIYKDTDFMLSAERTNRILAILTIWFTLSIPPMVMATFYGMNIPLPGGIVAGPWTFLGEYTTLIIVLIISAVSVLVIYLYLLRVGWIASSIRIRK
jgi:magnesium transporter